MVCSIFSQLVVHNIFAVRVIEMILVMVMVMVKLIVMALVVWMVIVMVHVIVCSSGGAYYHKLWCASPHWWLYEGAA